MLHRKRLLAALLAGAMTCSLAACGGGDVPDAEQGAAPVGTAATEPTAWEADAGILNTDDTDEALYEAAKTEGKVTIYSISARIHKIAASFMEKYPGITVEAFDISTNELLEKVTREFDANVHNADLIHIKDQDGTIYNEYITEKKFYNYRPGDILSHIDEAYSAYSTPLYIELTQVYYNNEKYPDGAPVDNLWDLTKPEWNGKVMIQNPMDNLSWSSWLTALCTGDGPALMEQAYRDVFGTDLVLSEGCENAGYEWVKRFKENDPMFAASDGEICEAVGTRGQNDPPIGIFSSVKFRKAAENDWALQPLCLAPTGGLPSINTLYIIAGCEHPNAAKLLMRYMMGGVDGDLTGYDNFNTLGGWPVRDDIAPPEGQQPLDEISLLPFDPQVIYENIGTFQDFWTMLS